MPTAKLAMISRYAFPIAMLLGIGMVVLGVVFMIMGFGAKSDITSALLKEQVVTSADAPIPGVEVRDVSTARAQQDAIQAHTYGRWGPYAELDRGDPNRQTYINGLTLRNSLNLAIIGFGLADLAIGVGAVTVVLGLILTALAIPLHLLVRNVARLESANTAR